MPLTNEEILMCNAFEHVSNKNADKTPMRVRRNGATKLWKTRPGDFKIPIKYGLYQHGYITPENVGDWLPEGLDPILAGERLG